MVASAAKSGAKDLTGTPESTRATIHVVVRCSGLVLALLFGCSASPVAAKDETPCSPDTAYELKSDLPFAGEQYLCYGFDASPVRGATLRGLRWSAPDSGGVRWHHATLYAVVDTYPDGPIPCDGMPQGSISLHVWAPGGNNLLLPADVGLELPATTQRLVVELHLLRTSTDPAASGSLGICLQHEPIAHRASFFAVVAPVPAIRPQMMETSSATCRFGGGAHLWSIWPHMHRVGTAIESTLLRASGESSTIVRVDPWDFSAQRTYPLDIDVASGDAIQAQCWWTNPTNEYVLPGLKTSDEMCNQGFIGWPAAALPCVESP
jgi:hypothetical protein